MTGQFCSGEYFNLTELWLVHPPVASPCFQRIVPLTFCSVFLFFMIIFICISIYLRKKHPPQLHPCTNKQKGRQFALGRVCVILLWSILVLVLWVEDPLPHEDATHLHWLLTLACGVMDLLLVWINYLGQWNSVTVNGCQLLFHLLFPVVYIPTLYNHIIQQLWTNVTLDALLLSMCIVDIVVSIVFSPLRTLYRTPQACPEAFADIFSKLTYSWLDSIIKFSYNQPLQGEDVFDLRQSEQIKWNINKFHQQLQTTSERRENSTGTVWQSPAAKKQSAKSPFEEDESTPLLLDCVMEMSPERSTPPAVSLSRGYFHSLGAFHPALFRTFLKVNGLPLLLGVILAMLYTCIQFVNPFLLELLISEVSNHDQKVIWRSLLLAVLFFLVGCITSVLTEMSFFVCTNVAVRLQSTLIGAIYRKAISLNNAAKQNYSTGEVVNLMSVDVERVQVFLTYLTALFNSPVQIVLCIVFLWQQLGVATLAGICALLLFLPINALLMHFIQRQDILQLDWKDRRLKLLNDILNGIRVLKLYAWEDSFMQRVLRFRTQETRCLANIYYGWTSVGVIWDMVPFFVMLASLLTFMYTGDGSNVLTPSRVFVSLALFNMLRFPMVVLPITLSYGVNGYVSFCRVQKFLQEDEIDLSHYESSPVWDHNSKRPVIEVQDGCFSWTASSRESGSAGAAVAPEKVNLQDINLAITTGQFVAVVGKIGVGKSSLLSALIGEIQPVSGKVSIQGKLAYVPQTSWIQHMTVKENILFGTPFDEVWYNKVLDSCALRSDLEILVKGDETFIGERGINLSGGQKQRVSLARAVYQNADVYLLDDPLSAVDAHVGKELFENLLSSSKGLLAKKTRVLVTHGLQWLPLVDEIIVVDEVGRISERGTYRELMTNGRAFAEVVRNNAVDSSEKSTPSSKPNTPLPDEGKRQLLSRQVSSHARRRKNTSRSFSSAMSRQTSGMADLMPLNNADTDSNDDDEEEEMEEGRVSFKVYLTYIRARGVLVCTVGVSFYALFAFTNVLSNIAIQLFSEHPIIANASTYSPMPANVYASVLEVTSTYMTWYGVIGIVCALEAVVFAMAHAYGSVRAARLLHNKLLGRILRAPLQFFDTTPNGRIINRLSKDIESVDTSVPSHWHDCLQCLFVVLASFAAIAYSTPWFVLALVPLVLVYFLIQNYYFPAARQTRRLASVFKSPVFTHFTESLAGISVIRASQHIDRFVDTNDANVDRNARLLFLKNCLQRWLNIRLDILSALVVFAAALFVTLAREWISPALVGLSISYALTVTENLRWMVMQISEMETDAVSIERISEYSQVEQEAELVNARITLTDNWPDKGCVQFDQFSVRYRPGLPLVLRGLDVKITAGEKVGIVGRTGAGKSSLTLALFRLIEAHSGKIVIDGWNISELGLHQLRNRITILPQDPVLFNGTLRDNIDPFGTHSEEELWHVLEQAHLKDWASSLTLGLNHECGDGGQNLSVGQRQLICLARALLRRTKLLILDEATAAVDQDTDRLLMQTIFEKFHNATVLIIAHRLKTILSTDRVLVMREGVIIEMGPPGKLMQDRSSTFHSMAKEAGMVN